MGHARQRRPSCFPSVLRSFYAQFGGRPFFCECFLLCSPKNTATATWYQVLVRTRCHTGTHRVSLSASSVCCCEIRRRELAWAFRPICKRVQAWPTLGESTSRVCCLSGVTTLLHLGTSPSEVIVSVSVTYLICSHRSRGTFTEQYISICISVFSVCCREMCLISIVVRTPHCGCGNPTSILGLDTMLHTCAVPSMNRSVREQSSPLGHHSSCEVTLCASRACKRPPCGAISGFYFTAASIMHNLSTSSHTTPIEFTHTEYHQVVEDPSQKTVIDLGSRIP